MFGLVDRIKNFFYNLDRAIASLFGAKPQETISSEAGRLAESIVNSYIQLARSGDPKWRIPIAKGLCEILNHIDPGHCSHAVERADRLDKADKE